MKQGEIWNANHDPSKGNEQAEFRPVVIVSGNLLNELLQVVFICPLTSKVKGYKGNPILTPNDLNRLKSKSEILVFHIRSVSKFRLIDKIGTISKEEIKTIQQTVSDILRY